MTDTQHDYSTLPSLIERLDAAEAKIREGQEEKAKVEPLIRAAAAEIQRRLDGEPVQPKRNAGPRGPRRPRKGRPDLEAQATAEESVAPRTPPPPRRTAAS
jgi:hypothetical protein